MARQVKHLRILLASPSDVAPERESVDRVVAELNRTLPAAVGVHLDLVAWETSSTPSLGSDPQAILNSQLGDDADIFIGLLWARMGTPTPRAASGTAEEFSRVYSRWKADPDSVAVMFYFKEAGVPVDVDTDQLRAVQEFRRSLQDAAITARFENAAELEMHLRVHLTRQVFSRAAQPQRASGGGVDESGPGHAPPARMSIETQSGEEEEEGLLDLVEKSSIGFAVMTDSVRRIGEETQEVGVFINAQAQELLALNMRHPEDARKGKLIVNRTGERMLAFSQRVDRELPALGKSALDAIGSVGKAAQLVPDFGPAAVQGIEGNLVALRGMRESVRMSRQQLGGWQRQLEQMPRVTTQFNRAKRETLTVMGRLDREFGRVEELATATESMITEVLERLQDV